MLARIGDGSTQYQPVAPKTAGPPPPPHSDGSVTHSVKSGETLGELSVRYGVSSQQILAANPQLRDPNALDDGQEISIPTLDNGGKLPVQVRVQSGESLTQIGTRHGVSVRDLVSANGIHNPDLVYPGQTLWIPVASKHGISLAGSGSNSLQPSIAAVDAAVKQVQGAQGKPQQQATAQASLTQAVENEIRARAHLQVPAGKDPSDSLLNSYGASIATRYANLPGVGSAIHQAVANQLAARGVDDALKQVDSAQRALTLAGSSASTQHSQLEQNVSNAQSHLQSQVETEIRTRAVTPAGQLPAEAAVQKYGSVITQRYAADPAALKALGGALAGAVPDFKAQAVVATAKSATSPAQALAKLSQGYAAASPQVQQHILANAGAQAILKSAANQATAPLSQVKPDSDSGDFYAQVHALRQSLQNLDHTASQLDPALGAAMVQEALPQIERYNSSYAAAHGGQDLTSDVLHTGPATIDAVMSLSGRIAGTAQGNADIARLAKLGFWDNNSVSNALYGGASAAYPEAIAARIRAAGQDPSNVISIIQQGVDQNERTVQADVKALGQHNEALSWLINTLGKSMTPTELQHAVTEYEGQKGWQTQNAKLTQQVIADSTTLTQNLKILGSLAQQNPQAASNLNLKSTISAAYNDQATAYGLTLAAGQNPNLYTDAKGQSYLTLVSDLKLADQGRKTAQLIGSLVVRSLVTKALKGVDWRGANPLAEAQQAIESLKSPVLSNWMGVNDNTVWNSAVKTVQKNLVSPSDDATTEKAKLGQMNQALNKLKALSSSTLPGQLLRSIAVAYAFANTVNSVQKFAAADGAPDKTMEGLNALTSAAGLAQKVTSLASGLGFVDAKSMWGTFAKDTSNGTISLVSSAFDLVEAGRSFSGWGEPQNTANGVFSTLSGVGGAAYGASQFAETGVFDGASEAVFGGGVAGGTLAAGLGLAGVGIVAVGVIGGAVYQQYEADHQYQGVGKDFLQAGGYSKAAAGALSSQDGLLTGAGGSSGVPFLVRYANMKHLTTEQLQSWVNGLTQAQVKTLDQCLLQTAGDSNGNPLEFTDGTPQTAVIPDYSGGPPAVIPRSNTRQVFESNLKSSGVPLPP
ncbi:MAG TPA: LysM peptidoglycan-binding domain-containing protein [Steroidobacteraceae bacterium]